MDKDIESRIKAEKRRLSKLFGHLSAEDKVLVNNLIDRAAWQKVQLEDLEEYITENGWVAPMKQSEKLPSFDRERPQAAEYQKLHANYLKTLKDLKQWLPKGDTEADDGFDAFVAGVG